MASTETQKRSNHSEPGPDNFRVEATRHARERFTPCPETHDSASMRRLASVSIVTSWVASRCRYQLSRCQCIRLPSALYFYLSTPRPLLAF